MTRFLISILLCFFFLPSRCGAQGDQGNRKSQPEETSRNRPQIETSLRASDLISASEFVSLIETNPVKARELVDQKKITSNKKTDIMLLLREGKYFLALNQIDDLLLVDQDNRDLLLAMKATALARLKLYEHAQSIAEKQLVAKSTRQRTIYYVALTYRVCKKHAKSLENVREALGLGEKTPELLNLHGLEHWATTVIKSNQTGRPVDEEAIRKSLSFFDEALKLSPTFFLPAYNKGRLNFLLRERVSFCSLDKAINNFVKANSIAESEYAHRYLGKCYAEKLFPSQNVNANADDAKTEAKALEYFKLVVNHYERAMELNKAYATPAAELANFLQACNRVSPEQSISSEYIASVAMKAVTRDPTLLPMAEIVAKHFQSLGAENKQIGDTVLTGIRQIHRLTRHLPVNRLPTKIEVTLPEYVKGIFTLEGGRSLLASLMELDLVGGGWYLVSIAEVDLNFRFQNGRTVLHELAISPAPKNILVLVNAGAKINIQDNVGQTPLAFAVARDCPLGAYFLLKGGADPNIADANGDTPIDHARNNRWPTAGSLLASVEMQLSIAKQLDEVRQAERLIQREMKSLHGNSWREKEYDLGSDAGK